MPHEYSVDTAHRLVRVRMWGALTRTEILATVAELVDDPRLSPEFSEVIDVTGATAAEIDTEDVRVIAGALLDSVARRAFVAPEPVTFGLARMFGSFRELKGSAEHVGVFHSVREAEEWLGLG